MHINDIYLRDDALYVEVKMYDRVYVVPVNDWLQLLIEFAEKATEHIQSLPRG